MLTKYSPHGEAEKANALKIALERGVTAAVIATTIPRTTISRWLLEHKKAQATRAKRSADKPKRPQAGIRWRGEKFRLVKDHSLLRYFIVRREDVSKMPKFCTVEHKFPDGRLAIHDCELVVSARSLRLHPSYTKRLADVHLCDMRGSFARTRMLESGLIKHTDDAELVQLILEMVEADRRKSNLEGQDGD